MDMKDETQSTKKSRVAPNKKPVRCRYFNTPKGCLAGDGCRFLHEKPKPTSTESTDSRSAKGKKQCRYGSNCRNPTKCGFLHDEPSKENSNEKEEKQNKASQPDAAPDRNAAGTKTTKKPKKCKFGADCRRKGCRFRHPQDENTGIDTKGPTNKGTEKEEPLDDAANADNIQGESSTGNLTFRDFKTPARTLGGRNNTMVSPATTLSSKGPIPREIPSSIKQEAARDLLKSLQGSPAVDNSDRPALVANEQWQSSALSNSTSSLGSMMDLPLQHLGHDLLNQLGFNENSEPKAKRSMRSFASKGDKENGKSNKQKPPKPHKARDQAKNGQNTAVHAPEKSMKAQQPIEKERSHDNDVESSRAKKKKKKQQKRAKVSKQRAPPKNQGESLTEPMKQNSEAEDESPVPSEDYSRGRVQESKASLGRFKKRRGDAGTAKIATLRQPAKVENTLAQDTNGHESTDPHRSPNAFSKAKPKTEGDAVTEVSKSKPYEDKDQVVAKKQPKSSKNEQSGADRQTNPSKAIKTKQIVASVPKKYEVRLEQNSSDSHESTDLHRSANDFSSASPKTKSVTVNEVSRGKLYEDPSKLDADADRQTHPSKVKLTKQNVASEPGKHEARLNENNIEHPNTSERAEHMEANTKEELNRVEDEKQRLARMREEARKQQAAAKERKKLQKSKKSERRLKDLENEFLRREKLWRDKAEKEAKYVSFLIELSAAEFVRQNKTTLVSLNVSAPKVMNDSEASKKLFEQCRAAYRVLYQVQSRVVVAGLDKAQNGRTGEIQFWDSKKEAFNVLLDTKKGNKETRLLKPGNLQVAGNVQDRKKKSKVEEYTMRIPSLYANLSLLYVIKVSDVDDVAAAPSTEEFLEALMTKRDARDFQARLEEEAEKEREKEERRRRAEQKARENAEWKRRKEEMRQEKAKYDRMRREAQRQRRQSRVCTGDVRECNCPECQFRRSFIRKMAQEFFEDFFFAFGFDEDDDDDDFDERWARKEAEERRAEDEKFAAVLGVDVDAPIEDIKRSYRSQALKFHPDKYREDNEFGLTKEESTERFKELLNAYDHLMSNFDD